MWLLLLCLCILIDKYALFCILFANWHSPATQTEVCPCFFLSRKANARVYLAKTGYGPQSLVNCVVLCIFVCICVLYYCHRVITQLQLNISYHMPYHIISYDDFIIEICCWTGTRVPTSKNRRPLRKQKRTGTLSTTKEIILYVGARLSEKQDSVSENVIAKVADRKICE
jgi:hypothetical protein